jgi:hypothetical protein
MSATLTNVQQIEFDALVKEQYRSRGFLLRDSIRMKSDVIGNQVEFRKVDQVIAVETAYLAAVTIQDPNYEKARATLLKYTAPTAVDEVQELTVNFDAKMENAMLVAHAMGRRSDQIIIDALTANPGDTIANGGTNFTYDKFTRTLEFFDDNAVPLEERFVAMSASSFRSLLQEDQFVSTFYTSNDVIDKARIRQYLGFNVIIIPQMTEGGLPKNGNIRKCFAWHKMSTGAGIGKNFRTEINYIPQNTSFLINGVFSMGAVVIDNRGVLEIDCDESV